MATYQIKGIYPTKKDDFDDLILIYAGMIENSFSKLKEVGADFQTSEIRFYTECAEVKCQLITS